MSLRVRLLFGLRGLGTSMTLAALLGRGFVQLESVEPRHVVLGLIGRPWRLTGDVQVVSPAEFRAFSLPGYVRVAWSFTIEPARGGCVLRTETRVAATDASARRRFGAYWWLIGPFSSHIRRSMLRSVAAAAVELEKAHELDGAVLVDFPLRGEWTAFNTPGHQIPSHGTDLLGQRYAYDIIRLDSRSGVHYHAASSLRLNLLGVPTAECYGWGEPIHAPIDGEVIEASDGAPERERILPLREIVAVLLNGLTFRPTKRGLQRLVGNHVVLRGDGFHALFAHLAPGSVAVTPGQTVRAGEVIGRVGHTGNSTAPHLHFQLMDSRNLLAARGVPCRFRRYEVLQGDEWRLVENGIPRRTDRLRSLETTPG